MTRYMLIFALMLGLTSNIYAQKKTPNIQQDNALLTAIESNDLSAAKLALNNGASPNARNDVGDTALVLAIHKGNLEISKTLISSNATKSLISWYGKLPIVEAALLKQDFIVKLLGTNIKEINAYDKMGWTALHAAAKTGNVNLAQWLLDQKINYEAADVSGASALQLAAAEGQTDAVKLLAALNYKSPLIDRFGRTPLVAAAAGGHTAILPLLTDRITDKTARRMELERSFQETVGVASLDSKTNFPPRESALLYLLDHGTNLNARDYKGKTPLIAAAESGSAIVVKFLLVHGADPNLKDLSGYTALGRAERMGKDEVIEVLKGGTQIH